MNRVPPSVVLNNIPSKCDIVGGMLVKGEKFQNTFACERETERSN